MASWIDRHTLQTYGYVVKQLLIMEVAMTYSVGNATRPGTLMSQGRIANTRMYSEKDVVSEGCNDMPCGKCHMAS
jgi:hypothetical protein